MAEDKLDKFLKSMYEKALRRFSMLTLAIIITVTIYVYVLALVAWPWAMPRNLVILNYIVFSIVIAASIICAVISHGQRNEIREIASAIRNRGASQLEVVIPGYRCNDLDVLIAEVKQLLAANNELRTPLDDMRRKCTTQSSFLRGLSEQIIAPIHLLLNNIEKSLMEGGLPSKVQERLEAMRVDGNDLVQLANTMLDIAALDKDTQLEFGKCSITSCSERAYDIMRPPLYFKRVWLDLEDNARNKELYCDKSLITQLMVALISHGAAGITGGGRVLLTVHDYTIEIGKQKYEAVLIEVIDSGNPIVLNSVFSVFEAVDQESLKQSPYRAAHKADLTLAANIAERHYGKIWAVPRSNGFVIRVAIPRDFREVQETINNDYKTGEMKNAA